jgi:hypothetical protein
MAVDPADANELQDIEQIEATVDARRNALATKWGEGAVVMKAPGDPYVMIVNKGKVRMVKVVYLSGGGS